MSYNPIKFAKKKAVDLGISALKGIRLIKGGADQKTTYGMIKGMSPPSKGGVETMRTMGMPSKPLLTNTARHASFFPKNTNIGRKYANKMKAERNKLQGAPKVKQQMPTASKDLLARPSRQEFTARVNRQRRASKRK